MTEVTGQSLSREAMITQIDPSNDRLSLVFRELWQNRELLYFLVWRDVKVRYKQTAIGISWAILQPLVTMFIFAVIFGSFVRVPSDGFPYPIFAYAALLPWVYFSQSMARCSGSLVGDASLLQKVYFPRLLLPLTAVITPLVDFLFGLIVLIGMIVWYGLPLTWNFVALPLFLLMTVASAFSVGLWLAPLNVRYRDVGIAIPVLIQLWMYASPVVYPVSLIPEKWRLLYSINPMVGVINGFRWVLLDEAVIDWQNIGVSVLTILCVLCLGMVVFKHTESVLADII